MHMRRKSSKPVDGDVSIRVEGEAGEAELQRETDEGVAKRGGDLFFFVDGG